MIWQSRMSFVTWSEVVILVYNMHMCLYLVDIKFRWCRRYSLQLWYFQFVNRGIYTELTEVCMGDFGYFINIHYSDGYKNLV